MVALCACVGLSLLHGACRVTRVPAWLTDQETPVRRLVSIVLAYRNEEEYLERCLDSVFAQDYDPIEVVTADGLSTDGSAAIVARYAREHPNVRQHENPHLRADHGFNVAISHAAGEIIILVGAHCVLAPDFVSKSVTILEESGADVVGGTIETDADGHVGKTIALALSSPFGTGSKFRYLRSAGPQYVDTVASSLRISSSTGD